MASSSFSCRLDLKKPKKKKFGNNWKERAKFKFIQKETPNRPKIPFVFL